MTNWTELSRAQSVEIAQLKDKLTACESNWSNEVLDMTAEIERLTADYEELEKSNKNRGAAVVLAQEVIAKNDKRIEELETAFKELRKALDKEQEETK